MEPTQEQYRKWIDWLHRIAEEYHIAKIKSDAQCALRWSANIVAQTMNKDK